MLKKTVMFFYALTLVVLAAATIVEHSKGTEWVSGNIYGAAWFSVLWAVLAALAVAYIIKRKMRKPGLVLLHASFIVILAGALTTHVFATKGMLHVRQGDTTSALMPAAPAMARHNCRSPSSSTPSVCSITAAPARQATMPRPSPWSMAHEPSMPPCR